MNANETHGEKAKWEPNKNASCCFEQIQEVAAIVWLPPPISQTIQVRLTRHRRNCWRNKH